MVPWRRSTIVSISASTVRAACAAYPNSLSNSLCFDIIWSWPVRSVAFITLAVGSGNVIVGSHPQCRLPCKTFSTPEAAGSPRKSGSPSTTLRLRLFFHKLPHQRGNVFRKCLFRLGECVGKIAFNVQLRHQRILGQDRDH